MHIWVLSNFDDIHSRMVVKEFWGALNGEDYDLLPEACDTIGLAITRPDQMELLSRLEVKGSELSHLRKYIPCMASLLSCCSHVFKHMYFCIANFRKIETF